MKKILAVLMILAMTFAVAACGTETEQTSIEPALSQDKAIEIALAEVEGAVKDEVTSVKYESEEKEYDVEIIHDGYEYEFEIAEDGTIISQGKEKAEEETAAEENDNLIGIDKAVEIALKEVEGATSDDVVKSKEDFDDGITVYDIEIVYNEYEYEFEIDGETGNILEKDSESIYED